METPVLFFYGKTDWMVGAEHYKNVHFPNMTLWESKVGHLPFLENTDDLKKSIINFGKEYKFLP